MGRGGAKSHVNWLANDNYLHKFRKVLLITKNATASRGSAPWSPIKGSPLDPAGLLRRPATPGRTGDRWYDRSFQPLQTFSIWRPVDKLSSFSFYLEEITFAIEHLHSCNNLQRTDGPGPPYLFSLSPLLPSVPILGAIGRATLPLNIHFQFLSGGDHIGNRTFLQSE